MRQVSSCPLVVTAFEELAPIWEGGCVTRSRVDRALCRNLGCRCLHVSGDRSTWIA